MTPLERAIEALEPMDAVQARAVVEGMIQGHQAYAQTQREWGMDVAPKTAPALRKLATSTAKLRAAMANLAGAFPGIVPTASDPVLAALLDRLDHEAGTVLRHKRGPREDLSRRELLRQAFGALGELATSQRVADLAMAVRELATGEPPNAASSWYRLADSICADLRCTERLMAFMVAHGGALSFADLADFTESEELRQK